MLWLLLGLASGLADGPLLTLGLWEALPLGDELVLALALWLVAAHMQLTWKHIACGNDMGKRGKKRTSQTKPYMHGVNSDSPKEMRSPSKKPNHHTSTGLGRKRWLPLTR